jgi:hypothetical protein
MAARSIAAKNIGALRITPRAFRSRAARSPRIAVK